MSHTDPNCVFCKIVAGQIPSKKVYEDSELIAFHDIHPWAPVHVLIVPREHVASLSDVDASHEQWLGKMLLLAPTLMKEMGVTNGDRTVITTGAVGGPEGCTLPKHPFGRPSQVGLR